MGLLFLQGSTQTLCSFTEHRPLEGPSGEGKVVTVLGQDNLSRQVI